MCRPSSDFMRHLVLSTGSATFCRLESCSSPWPLTPLALLWRFLLLPLLLLYPFPWPFPSTWPFSRGNSTDGVLRALLRVVTIVDVTVCSTENEPRLLSAIEQSKNRLCVAKTFTSCQGSGLSR